MHKQFGVKDYDTILMNNVKHRMLEIRNLKINTFTYLPLVWVRHKEPAKLHPSNFITQKPLFTCLTLALVSILRL